MYIMKDNGSRIFLVRLISIDITSFDNIQGHTVVKLTAWLYDLCG